ncbi:ATP-binding protein [Sphingomonas sp.]|jgi:predicted kinase|uniref:AAA family ATPase n=1 Tax=Sphingomonas sp. TaxID=28214 RepID=UPI00261E3642|nr:ATP-binding protein [Sphingomonas sp.]MDF2495442.1 kinase [Sphingomonas sp.]
MLIVFAGLPGAGKSTIAKALAARNALTYVRIDDIKNALARHVSPARQVGAEGYQVAYAVTLANLRLGNGVVADSVNPVRDSRQGWRHVAEQADVSLLEVECICSDEAEHRRRVETRVSDMDGWRLPSWDEVLSRQYEPWETDPLVIDTASSSPEAAVREIEARITLAINQRRLSSSLGDMS